MEPPLKTKQVQLTRGRVMAIVDPPITRARGLSAPKTELFAPAGCSVGIDCWGQPWQTPHGASPASKARAANVGMGYEYY
jgi:hypothetical protein